MPQEGFNCPVYNALVIRLTALFCACTALAAAADIRIGIIGTDTSHATAFTRILNDPSSPDHVPGARVVAAFKGGSPDIEESASRIERFTKELGRASCRERV